MMIAAHKIRLDPNQAQQAYFVRACGTSRFAYNWALAEWRRQYEAGEKPSEAKLRKQLNAIKADKFPWMTEVTKCAPQQAIKDLGQAFQRFFKKQGRYPRFHKKGCRDSFRADNGPPNKHASAVKTDGRRIQLPRVGWVRMREAVRFKGRILSAVVSRVADRWFVALTVETSDVFRAKPKPGTTVGVDLGVKALATLSDGTVVTGPKALRSNLDRLRRLSRAHSRKKKGSANRRKSTMRLARLHYRIACIRADALHKLTTFLAEHFETVCIEDLNVRGMVKNLRLARAISDMGFGEFRRQIGYKAERVAVVDRWFPSSKTCSGCGSIIDELPLSVRTWTCQDCDAEHDRDINAAINIKRHAVSSTVSACGDRGSGRRKPAKPRSMKQEPTQVTL